MNLFKYIYVHACRDGIEKLLMHEPIILCNVYLILLRIYSIYSYIYIKYIVYKIKCPKVTTILIKFSLITDHKWQRYYIQVYGSIGFDNFVENTCQKWVRNVFSRFSQGL